MDSLIEPEERLGQEQLLQAPWGELGRSCTLGIVAWGCKMLLSVANTISYEGREEYLQLTMHRPKDQGLITVSNHTSTLDDPAIISAMTPLSYFFTEHRHRGMRWTLCAREFCYSNKLLGQFFQSGKTLPIERGAGLDQLSMRSMGRVVGDGGWLHVFPEGRINFSGKLGALRWGVGKLICDAMKHNGGRQPVVLPMYHSGMGHVMPFKATIPSMGHSLHVVVGEPVELGDISCRCNQAAWDQKEVWQQMTARIGESLLALEARAPPNPEQPEGVRRHGFKVPGDSSRAAAKEAVDAMPS